MVMGVNMRLTHKNAWMVVVLVLPLMEVFMLMPKAFKLRLMFPG